MITSTSFLLQTSLSRFINIFLPWLYQIQCSCSCYSSILSHSWSFYPILWFLKMYIIDFFKILLHIFQWSLKMKVFFFVRRYFWKISILPHYSRNGSSATHIIRFLLYLFDIQYLEGVLFCTLRIGWQKKNFHFEYDP